MRFFRKQITGTLRRWGDDYYWKACFRLAKAYHYGLGIERSLDRAVELMAKAKNLYEARDNEVAAGDITREEFYREWLLLNQDAGAF